MAINIIPTAISGVYIIETVPHRDDRGAFGRVWCRFELEAAGLDTKLEQANFGYNRLAGTLRGLHFQRQPHEEVKLVRCTRGAVFDVAVDLRRDSKTFLDHLSVELTADNHRQLYIPKGCAHGYQALTDNSEICYLTSARYSPEAATGVRYDDPDLGIAWPLAVTAISIADGQWPAAVACPDL